MTFSGERRETWAFRDRFDEMKVVPEEVLKGVKNEAPPGKFFSGKSVTNPQEISTWFPAPEGQTWVQKYGFYCSDKEAYCLKKYLETLMSEDRIERSWEERGLLAYWCPVLKRFVSEGERLRQEHWFHNGDGSANQRYYYNQMEMLDMHGGLENLPPSIDKVDGSSELGNQDSKMPAKKQKTK